MSTSWSQSRSGFSSCLPEAAALLAPRRLNFYARIPPAFDYTRHVYSLHGKPDFLATQIEAVLEGRYDHNFDSGM